jgi:hypothetical protein
MEMIMERRKEYNEMTEYQLLRYIDKLNEQIQKNFED